MFDCLPLYHSVGGVVAAGATLVGGGSRRDPAAILGLGFLARHVAIPVVRCFNTSASCAGIWSMPRSRSCRDRRIACGSPAATACGRRSGRSFSRVSGFPRILEYYASTEGNFSLYNCEGQPGSIGRIPPFLADRLPVRLLKFDVGASGEPWRNAAGFCEPATPTKSARPWA
jgi:fatty-acyl-CoA synthase